MKLNLQQLIVRKEIMRKRNQSMVSERILNGCIKNYIGERDRKKVTKIERSNWAGKSLIHAREKWKSWDKLALFMGSPRLGYVSAASRRRIVTFRIFLLNKKNWILLWHISVLDMWICCSRDFNISVCIP